MTTKQTDALKQAQAVLRGLTFKDRKITAALEAIHRALETLPTMDIPKERLALNVRHQDCHKAADAFWDYWKENGETHKHGYYESTWGAINRALRTVGVVEHEHMRAAADAIDAAMLAAKEGGA